ncbi:flagellar hook-length control protein FliK [Rhizobium sp. SGZ-381]|uniref:flagellar hook-length control protein FliK n=1 Tax=Rhizobium sp. SGZ-381 TaxID=3342800 RepID=UPI00366B31CB
MVAVDVSARAPAVDAASASKTSGSGRGEGAEGGFGSALDSLDQGGRQPSARAGGEENSAHPADGETAGEEQGAAKSRLDLGPAALARSRLPAGAGETLQSRLRTSIDAEKASADTGETQGKATGEATASGKTAHGGKSLKDLEKTASDARDDAAGAQETQGEGKASTGETLASMLTLLAGPGTTGGAGEALTALRQAGAAIKGTRAGEDGKGERVAAATAKSDALSALSGEGQKVVLPNDDGASGAAMDERTFRFASARGKGASMDMVIGTGRDGTATFETKAASNGAAETISVLDSRRFLGFGQSINGAALTAAMSGDPEWASAMQPGSALSNAASQTSTGNVVNTLKLQMTPIDLGTVTATLKLVGDTLNVQLTVENRAAHKQLTQDTSGILDALRAQGFSVDQVTVTVAPAAATDVSAQPQDLGQQAAGSGPGREGGSGRDQQAQSSGQPGSSTSGMIENDPQTDTGADRARPDLLYL